MNSSYTRRYRYIYICWYLLSICTSIINIRLVLVAKPISVVRVSRLVELNDACKLLGSNQSDHLSLPKYPLLLFLSFSFLFLIGFTWQTTGADNIILVALRLASEENNVTPLPLSKELGSGFWTKTDTFKPAILEFLYYDGKVNEGSDRNELYFQNLLSIVQQVYDL